jgi:hypothetical protein
MFPILLLQAAILLASCSERDGNCDTALRGDEVEIEMTFARPATYASGDETNEEKAIHTLDLLVFQRQGAGGSGSANDALFVEKRYAWAKSGSPDKYRSIIRMGDHLDIYCAVNARSLLDAVEAAGGLVSGTTSWTQLREKLVLVSPADLATNLAAKGLPMWGYLYDQTIADKAYTSLGTVKLLRAVASADITVSAGRFTLQKGYVVFGADKGLLPFSPTNLDVTDNVKNPEIPAGMKAEVDLSYAGLTSTAPQAIDNRFYMYENDAPLVTGTGRRSTKVVLEGIYTGPGGSGKTTFYPLSFRDADDRKLQVKRNWKYVLVVTGVNGDGYPSLDAAKNGEDLNMDYKVINWNGNDDDDIQIIGAKYLANYPKNVALERPAASSKKALVKSNFDIGDFKLELSHGGKFPDPADMTKIENARFSVKIAAGSNPEEIEFTYSTLAAYTPSATDNPSILKVTVGGVLVFETTITQYDETPVDWNDGGDQDIDI